MKITLIILALAIVIVGGAAIVTGPKLMESLSGLKSENQGTKVRTQEMSEQLLVEVVSAPGQIEPFHKVEISSRVSARIEALPFREGDPVRKGDVIVRLDDRDLQALLEAARARRDGEQYRLQSEQARLEGLLSNQSFAQKELERMQNLHDSGDVSRRSLDDAQQSVDDLSANIEAAKHTISVIGSTLTGSEADIARAEDALGNTVIRSPMDGIITVLDMEVGEQVLGTFNNIGSRIMTIADLTRMILRAEIAESDIAAVEPGQAAKIHINAYPDTALAGTVTRIALQRTISSQGAGVFEAEIEIDLQGRALRSGHAANADIEIATHRGLLVESQGIVERLIEDLADEIRLNDPLIDRSKRTTSVLYRLVDGKSVCTPVRVGPSDLTQTVIVEGLRVGDVVVVGPYKVLEKLEDDEDIQDERDAEVEAVVGEESVTDLDAAVEGSDGA